MLHVQLAAGSLAALPWSEQQLLQPANSVSQRDHVRLAKSSNVAHAMPTTLQVGLDSSTAPSSQTLLKPKASTPLARVQHAYIEDALCFQP